MFTNSRLPLCREASQQTEAREGAGEESELDRCHAEAVRQSGLPVPDNYGYCQICQEADLSNEQGGGGRGRRADYETCHPSPIGTISFIRSIKTIKCSQPPLRSRGDSDYENNNSFKNYLNVLRELWALASDGVQHSQAGRQKTKTNWETTVASVWKATPGLLKPNTLCEFQRLSKSLFWVAFQRHLIHMCKNKKPAQRWYSRFLWERLFLWGGGGGWGREEQKRRTRKALLFFFF